MPATYMGRFDTGQAPVALFAGPQIGAIRSVPMRGFVTRGFGYYDAEGGEQVGPPAPVESDAEPIPDDAGFDWQGLFGALGKLAPLIDAAGRILNPQTGQQVGQLPPGWSQQQFMAAYQKKSGVPAWLLPVGIGAGVLVVGAVLFLALRK